MKTLERALRRALASVDLGARVAAALERDVADRPVQVLAIGKAAAAMLGGAIGSAQVTAALAIVPHGAPAPAVERRVAVVHASHPIPDRSSVRAAERALAFAASARGDLVVLISGGASALVCAPRGVRLAEKKRITRALLLGGADIVAINVVRRHLSAIKGGGLLAVAHARRVLTLIASDVIGGALHDIGSGPSVPDPTTSADARRIFRRYLGDAATPAFVETLKPAAAPRNARARLIASPDDLAKSFARELRSLGFRPRALPPSTVPLDDMVVEYTRRARSLAPGEALVRAAEPSLVVARRAGRGGRASHLAAAMLGALPADVSFLAAASDGVDGASDAAGAIVRGIDRFDPAERARALWAFDTATLHASLGSAIALGPTGHNLTDLHALVRAR